VDCLVDPFGLMPMYVYDSWVCPICISSLMNSSLICPIIQKFGIFIHVSFLNNFLGYIHFTGGNSQWQFQLDLCCTLVTLPSLSLPLKAIARGFFILFCRGIRSSPTVYESWSQYIHVEFINLTLKIFPNLCS
jgi:hypothetical protein